MRALRTPQATESASIAAALHRKVKLGRRVMLLASLCILAFSPAAVMAQTDPSDRTTGKAIKKPESAFPKPKDGIFGKAPKIDDALPLNLQADELVYDTAGNKVVARGNVEIQYEKNNLKADEVIYDQSANTLSASGNVVLIDANGNVVRAESYTLTDDFRDGFVQSLSVVARDNSRISAEQGTRRNADVTEFSNAKFTACKSDGTTPPLWCIAAGKITHDTSAGTIAYQDAQFEIFGTPVFYLPYFEHADPSTKRRSGILAPQIGNSETLGFFTEIPYYVALAPNYDFTFHPRYMSNQGVLWMGDWRHKLANGQYSVNLAGMDQDGDDLRNSTLFTDARRAELDGFRGSLETRGEFSLSSWWSYGWDVTLESDDTFRRFYKLDSILLTDRVNNLYFKGQSERSYFATNFYHFGGLLIEDTSQSESMAHPVVDYNYVADTPVLGGELKINANALSFTRSDGVLSRADQEMQRAIAEVKWRRRLTDQIGITYTPFGELRGDIYQYNNYRDPLTAEFVDSDSVARGLATGGVTVSYPWVANGGGATHVIEPIGQVIGRQGGVSQAGLPDEDAKSLVFDDTNLFETTKFSGYDRLETGSRANVGLQYTFQPWSGGYARVLAGQSFHLSGDNPYSSSEQQVICDPDGAGPAAPRPVTVGTGLDDQCNQVFSNRSGLETDSSDYVVGVYLAPMDAFRLISQSRFDDETFELRREDAAVSVNYGPLTATAAYSYRFGDPELAIDSQQDVLGSLGLRLTDRWSVTAGFRYDIDEQMRLADSIQVRYQDDCVVLSASYIETFINDPARDIEPDRTLMFRVELKYLGGYAYQTDMLNGILGDQASR